MREIMLDFANVLFVIVVFGLITAACIMWVKSSLNTLRQSRIELDMAIASAETLKRRLAWDDVVIAVLRKYYEEHEGLMFTDGVSINANIKIDCEDCAYEPSAEK